MTIFSEQLETIFQEITTRFTNHPQIEVTPLAGDPPEQYRITYHVQGLCQKNDTIEGCADHTVLISLPFGFPHFPPNCRPESPVFHPDFDQTAICIGEFWEETQSIPELILHIGRMISGEIFSTSSAFNEEAAIWYKEHPEKLPLDTIQTNASPLPPDSLPDGIEQPEEPLELDFIDDSHLSLLEDSEPIAVPDESSEIISQASFPAEVPHLASPSSERSSESQKLAEARKRHQLAEEYEHQGRPGKAQEIYQDIKDAIPDYPEIDKDINRTEYAIGMLGDFISDDTTSATADTSNKKTKPQVASPPTKKTVNVQPKAKQPVPQSAVAIGSGCALVLIAIAALWFYMSTQMGRAQELLTECKQLIETDRFDEAEQKCAEALRATKSVFIIKQQEKKLITEKIKEIHNSQRFKDGIALTQTSKGEKLQEWEQLLRQSDQLMLKHNWKDALAGYSRILQFTTEITAVDRAIMDQIRQNIILARAHIFIEAGEKALAGADWGNAKTNLSNALELTQQNPLISSPELVTKIKALIRQVDFNTFMTTGEELYNKGEWENALAAFEQAKAVEHEGHFADTTTFASLEEVIARTKVYHTLEQGKKAFADARWDQAIEYYETALKLLEENSETLKRDNPVQSQQKIARLLLHAAIIRDKQGVAAHLKNKEFAKAIDQMQSLLSTINKSPFPTEAEFQAISKETQDSIIQTKEELLLDEQTSYLTTHYQKLFTQHNPNLTAENLSNPKVTFLKKINNKYLFRLQCSEQGHGRPVILQSSYLYDPATGKWTIYLNDASAEQKNPAGQAILSAAYQSQENQMIEAGKNYLMNNFQTLFNRGDPDLLPENLSRPQVTFLKKMDEKLLFLLQCFDSGPGTPTLRKARYIFDPASGQWTEDPGQQKK